MKLKNLSIILSTVVITFSISNSVSAKNNYNISRLYGENRYETSVNISNKFSQDKIDNIIIASGNDFPDALAGSVLSKKLNAPILLVDKTPDENLNSINYIKNHLTSNGTIYVLGGKGSVNEIYINYFKTTGYNVKRLGGATRFETNKSIVNFLNVKKGTPLVLVNGYGFADALSVSSIAASKGYPILMSDANNLPTEIVEVVNNIQPSKVFIVGGEGSLSSSIIDQIKNVVPSLGINIVRIGGISRYETSLNVCKYFNLDRDTALIANGENFPDALSGSALAAKLNAPIILTDGSNIITQKRYLDSMNYSNLILLGGKSAVSEAAENILKGNEKALFIIKSAYQEHNKKYIDGYFVKRVTDLDEARDYEKRTGNIVIWNDHDGLGEYIPDDGFDMPISSTVTLEVGDSVKINEIDFDTSGNILHVDKNFNDIISGYYKDKPVFNITLKNGTVTEMCQEYRP